MNDLSSDELFSWSGVLAVEELQRSGDLLIRIFPWAFQPHPKEKPVWVAHLTAARWDSVEPTELAGEEVEIEVGNQQLVISELYGGRECSVSFDKVDLALCPYQMSDWEAQVSSLMDTIDRRENELGQIKRERDALVRLLREEARRSELRASASEEHQLREKRVASLIQRLQRMMRAPS